MKNGLFGKLKSLKKTDRKILEKKEMSICQNLLETVSQNLWEIDYRTNNITISRTEHLPKKNRFDNFHNFIIEFVHKDDVDSVFESFNELLNGKSNKVNAIYRLKGENDNKWYISTGFVLKNAQNEIVKIKGISIDISYQKKIEQDLFKKTYCDKLTDMRNRTRIIEDYKIMQDMFNKKKIAFAFIDIDNFKYINNIYGYAIGDLLILSLSKIIQERYTIDHMTARIEADRFLIIFKDFENRDKLEKELHELIEYISSYFFFSEQEENISISIGVSYLGDHGFGFEDLYKYSEIALYYAKQHGKQQLKVYEKSFFDNVNKSIQFVNQLKKAITNDEFSLFYQPILDIDENIVGFEALVRWVSEGRTIPPLDFIPIAETSGLIKDLEIIIFDRAFKQLKVWQENNNFSGFISINLSTCGLINKNIDVYLKNLLEKHSISPDRIEIEITESVLINDMQNTKRILETLKFMGFRISLDDFGTGYSSLSYLRELPIDKVKLDKSFIDSSLKIKKDEIILKSIIDLAHLLEFKIVAEGVETQIQNSFLKELKCDYLQGYLFSKPLKNKEIESKWL